MSVAVFTTWWITREVITLYSSDKGKGRYSSSWEPHLRATGCHLPYGITQCYLPPDTSERAPPNPSHAGWYSIYLPRRDGRLIWPSWLNSAPAGSRTSDLSIRSLMPNRCTTKTVCGTNCSIGQGCADTVYVFSNFKSLSLKNWVVISSIFKVPVDLCLYFYIYYRSRKHLQPVDAVCLLDTS